VTNVPSYRKAKAVTVDVPGIGPVAGDLAWSGNWFFLVEKHGQDLALANVDKLTDYAWRVRQAVNAGPHPEVDHVELFGPAQNPGGNSRNFVLCPGLEYDRSPCGTGTSAKLACLFADSKLHAGETWRQESIIGSVFEGKVSIEGDKVIPTITGTAFVTAELELIFDPPDPFRGGITA
jgi:4-hydroxyproline epimerase